ncbi:phosphonate ABC transporter, permease protein PhnE [Butyrivibrio proteoclasticus]|uniref:phosphonate ABC transporter, permease protein PhnE n=1 Tax=Butyrivibrio proteoclasticus TaxID=43305 RepID=UPI00047AD23D|nr:phosphonate ABC transporter, permease protein PhnE [Butyrivibrio proteoclasticus]
MNKRIEEAYAKRPKNWVYNTVLAVITIGLIIWSAGVVETSGSTAGGGQIARNVLKGLFTPDLKFLFDFSTSGVPYLMLETLCIAFLGTIVGAIISVPLAFISASTLAPKPIAFIGRMLIMAIRTVPNFIYALAFIRVSGPGPFAGLLTMGVCSVGMVSKMYIEAIEDLDVHVVESLDAAGCNSWQKIRYGILPQLMPNFASTAIYRFDINLRDATILGMVGAGGFGAPLIFAMNGYRWNEAGAILAGLIVLILIIEFISTKIRVKLTRG